MRLSKLCLALALALAVAACVAPGARAGVVVLPNTEATLEGNNTSTSGGVLGTSAFTNQFFFTSSLLTGVPVGAQIIGLSVRVDGAVAAGLYPTSNLSWTSYDVTLAQANVSLSSFVSGGSSVSGNMLNAQQVRSGSLTVNAQSFTALGSGPNSFGPLITFATPYTYQGGDLVLLVSHSAATGPGFNVDATSNGFNSTFSQRTALSYGATSVSTTTAAPVIQLTFAVPEPGPVALSAVLVAAATSARLWTRRAPRARA